MSAPEQRAGQVPASMVPLHLVISGIDNWFEASHLIRLFHNVEPVVPAADADLSAIPGWLVRLEAWEEHGWFKTRTNILLDGVQKGIGELDFELGITPAVTDMFLQSRKLCAGTALYRALSQAFGVTLPWGSLTGVRPVKLASCCLDAGMGEAETNALLQNRTGMDAEKAAAVWEVARRERPLLIPPDRSVSLYVGIPFCSTRCLYCSFTSYPIQRHGALIPAYMAALGKEIRFVGEWLRKTGKSLSTVYIGGGTPTALPIAHLGALLDDMAEWLPMGTALEFTVEAGRPDTVDLAKLERIKAAGATRISINPQSMQEKTLKRIGRAHTPEQVEEAFAMARQTGFDNINADLIAGLPGETTEDFRHTLERMAPLRPDSLTVHTMAVKRASRLHETMVDGTADAATPDAVIQEMIADAANFAQNAGLFPYYLYRQKNILANLENTGYARPGCECRYNVETMSERQTILALGSGGITKVSVGGEPLERTFNVRELGHYVGRIDEMLERKRELLERRFPKNESQDDP